MKCRIDIKGQKIWTDDNNLHSTRPPSVDIQLYRDGEPIENINVNTFGDGKYKFPCLLKWKNKSEKYFYTVDEPITPLGYVKTVRGYDVVNTLIGVIISGVKIWNDDHDDEGYRPDEITLRLWQNGVEADALQLSKPVGEDRVLFSFGERPFADASGVPYVYTVTEDAVENYQTAIDGFNITNTLNVPIVPFSFKKSDSATGDTLQGGVFSLKKNGELLSTAESDLNGTVTFNLRGKGVFELEEIEPPDGYIIDPDIHEIVVTADGQITVDDQPATDFWVENDPLP